MAKVTVTIGSAGATGGSVSVFITGPNFSTNYMIDLAKPLPPQSFIMVPDTYSIRVHGYSGGTVSLSVDESVTNLANDTCAAPNILMIDPFTVV